MNEYAYRLSRAGIARHPFYISLLGIGLWSVEELCYFFCHNPALIDESVLNEGLTRWLTEEFRMHSTALAMERGMKSGAPVSDILLPLLRDSGYLDPAELRAFMKTLQSMAAGGAPLLLKMKGDALAQNRRYGEAVRVYSQAEELSRKCSPDFMARLLHNRGVALMQLLSFEEGYRAFRKAVTFDDSLKRRKTCLLAAGLAKPRERFLEEAEELLADEALIREVTEELDALAIQPVSPPVDPRRELRRIRRAYHSEAGA